jgi:hypothetical protein
MQGTCQARYGACHEDLSDAPRSRLRKAIDEADVSAIPDLITLGKQEAPKMDWKKILQV